MRVQLTQSRQGAGQVVQVVHGEGQRVGHFLAVRSDLGGAGAQVQVEEVGLGGREGQEGPAGGTASQAGEEGGRFPERAEGRGARGLCAPLQGLGRVDADVTTQLQPQRAHRSPVRRLQHHRGARPAARSEP